MRDNTNEVIMKVESLLPTFIEGFTDLQTEYLQITRGFFETCYIMEKKVLDKTGVDQRAIEVFDKYIRTSTRASISWIEMTNNLQKTFVDNTILVIKCYEENVKLILSSYAKILEYTIAFFTNKI